MAIAPTAKSGLIYKKVFIFLCRHQKLNLRHELFAAIQSLHSEHDHL
jgi:hypothetical protein